MSKTYKTWEVIKMLTENPTLKFVADSCCGFGYKMSVNVGYFQFDVYSYDETYINPTKYAGGGFNGNIRTNLEWELIQEPMSFMEAVKAFRQGKTITCEIENIKFTYKGYDINECLIDLAGHAMSYEEILEGKWYIK